MNTLIATAVDYEDLGIKTILVTAIMALASVVIFLYKSKEAALKEKDAKILEVIKDHQEDLKESNNDMKSLIEKYTLFTNSLKELVHANKL